MDLRISGQYGPNHNFGPLGIRCPACRRQGTFQSLGVSDVAWVRETMFEGRKGGMTVGIGMRVCPHPDCRSAVFIVRDGSETTCLPPEVIDFDPGNLPGPILSTLEEAIKCHAAGCYRAAALMIRRTLEELCENKKAAGPNLKVRIAALNGVAVMPSELLNAADELRILGNDAAHIEAKDYDKIGKDESMLAIELTKELLKAVYQYASLVDRLKALRKGGA